MAIELKSSTINLNQSASFTFDRPVLANVVGISFFSLTYGNTDHHVKKISLSIQTSWSGNSVQASVTAQLIDASGNLIDKGDSKVGLICIANTDSADNNLSFATVDGILTGTQSTPISLPGSSLKFAQPGIAGFALSFGDGDHHLRQMLVSLGFAQHGTTGQISADAAMVDSSGHEASTESADAVLIAGNYAETGMEIAILTNQQTTSSQQVSFSKPLSSAVVMMNSFTITFGGDDHHVKTVGAGCSGWSLDSSDTSKVTLDNARAFVSDNSGNTQDNHASFVNLVVVGIPKG
jgi:hypothetical protein